MLIDTNIFLEFLLGQEKADRCFSFIQNAANQKEAECIISDFNVDSILIALEKNNKSADEMKDLLIEIINCRGIEIYNISLDDRIKSIELMKKYNLDYDDAITLQAAIATGSKEIMSFDKHFDKVNEIKRIEV